MSFYLNQIFSKAPEVLIEQLSIDSRMPMQNAMFFCIPGVVYNGHQFVKQAIENGARVIIYDEDIDTSYNAIFIRVKDSVELLIRVAQMFYQHPENGLNSYVVSGCYGKSTVNYLLYELLKKKEKTGYIGERGIEDGKNHLMNKARTLTIVDFFRCLYKMKENNVKSAVFESSVQNLNYKKLDGIHPNVFIYTITSEESLEYRETNKDYEKSLFAYMRRLDPNTLVVVNSDDILYEDMKRNTTNTYVTYGRNDDADFRITSIVLSKVGSSFNIVTNNQKYHVETKLIGLSSVYNVAAVLAGLSQRFDLNELIEDIRNVSPLQGSMEPIDEGQNFTVIVDGANNYQTISRIYSFAENIAEGHQVIAVVPINYIDNAMKLDDLMTISSKACSLCVLTSGDTYGKDIGELLKKAESYFTKTRCTVIEDRQTAIEVALDSANQNDVVLILGKGDEDFIYKKAGKVHYETDEKIVRNYLKKMHETSDDVYFDA